MAFKILPSNVSILQQRQPRIEEPDYLTWVRKLSCVNCGRSSSEVFRTEAAHIRFNDARYGKVSGGAEKPDDMFSLPLCHWCHSNQTDVGEGPKFWEELGMDPHAMCLALRHIAYPSIEEGERLVRAWNGWIR